MKFCFETGHIMNKFYLSLLAFLIMAGIFFFQSRSISANQPLLLDDATNGFAVVELFTSEGCSSCPPADRLLSVIAREARAKQRPVYALSFHVDYWNYIGWTDPYSSEMFSNRQREYAQAFRSARIYTPQMIVNGTTEFVGSNARTAKSSIKSALSNSSNLRIQAAAKADESRLVRINYSVSNFPQGARVNIALVERGLAQNVSRGENSGKKLLHDNVVRAWKQFAKGVASVSMEAPPEVNFKNTSVVVYVQDPKGMAVLGATAVDLALMKS